MALAATGLPAIKKLLSGEAGALDTVDAAATIADVLTPALPLAALYHGTSSMRLPSILRAGLQPRAGKATAAFPAPNSARGVFLAPDREVAQQFAERAVGKDKIAILSSIFGDFLDRPGSSTALRSASTDLDRLVRPALLKVDDAGRASDLPAIGSYEKVFSQPFSPERILQVETDAPDESFELLRILASFLRKNKDSFLPR